MERREGKGEERRSEDRNTAAVCNTMIIDQVTNQRREKERERKNAAAPKGRCRLFPDDDAVVGAVEPNFLRSLMVNFILGDPHTRFGEETGRMNICGISLSVAYPAQSLSGRPVTHLDDFRCPFDNLPHPHPHASIGRPAAVPHRAHVSVPVSLPSPPPPLASLLQSRAPAQNTASIFNVQTSSCKLRVPNFSFQNCGYPM